MLHRITICAAAMGLSACSPGNLAPLPDQSIPLSQEEKRKTEFGKVFGKDLLTFEPFKKNEAGSQTYQPHVNPLLWNAALGVVSFIPLGSVDSQAGIILTEWYVVPERPQERIKILVRITDRQLRSDAVHVSCYKETQTRQGTWVQAKISPEIASHLQDLILEKAKQLNLQVSK